MNRHLKQLIEIVPPPQAPIENGGAEAFRQIEEQLGLRLPDDYKELINSYGGGKWSAQRMENGLLRGTQS